MARVIHMAQLLSEDVIVDLGNGRRYTIPGDTSAVTMMELAGLQDELVSNQQSIEAAEDLDPDLGMRQVELVTELDAKLLALLRIRQPDLDATGLSSEQLGWFLGAILTGFRELSGDEPDPPPTPNRESRRAARSAPKTRSKPSSGSASS